MPESLALRQPDKFRVDLTVLLVGEQVIQPSPGEHVLPQRRRVLTLVSSDPGLRAYVFTFGP